MISLPHFLACDDTLNGGYLLQVHTQSDTPGMFSCAKTDTGARAYTYYVMADGTAL